MNLVKLERISDMLRSQVESGAAVQAALRTF